MTSGTSGDGGWGFVAGREPATPGTPQHNELDRALQAVAILLDWRKRVAFRCDVTVRLGSDLLEYRLIARPRELYYQVTNIQTGAVESYDPESGMIHEGSSQRPLQPNQLATEPMAARLAFPISLGIWGRPGDSYRITGAQHRTSQLVVALTHQQDATLTGEMVIDQDRRTAIRLDTPTLGIQYRDIQPDHDDEAVG